MIKPHQVLNEHKTTFHFQQKQSYQLNLPSGREERSISWICDLKQTDICFLLCNKLLRSDERQQWRLPKES